MDMRSIMKTILAALALLVLSSLAWAQPASEPPQKELWRSGPGFQLLPKSLQKNPYLDMTVYTEVTAKGGAAPQATTESPIYYKMQSGSYFSRGAEITLHSPPVTELKQMITDSLAKSHYLPEQPDHPATLLITFNWGCVTIPSIDLDPYTGKATTMDNKLLRKEARKALESLVYGSSKPGDEDMENYLAAQAGHDVYYIVATAYPVDAKPRVEVDPKLGPKPTPPTMIKQVLWRTKMTVAAAGVNMQQTFPKLIATAAPYYGKVMKTPHISMARFEGTVTIGTPQVIGVEP